MLIGILLTIIVGLFTLLGTLIVWKTKNNQKIADFSICIAFGVMLSLSILEIIPEEIELFSIDFKEGSIFLLIIASALIGIGILKVLDHFIPEHEAHNHSKKAQNENLLHIGIVSSIALILHNIIEGIALAAICKADTKLAYLMCIGIGLHNIPMGMVITSTIYKGNKNKKRTLLYLMGISLSTFAGGLLFFILPGNIITDNVLGILLGITLGMLIYIILFELFPVVKKIKDEKNKIMGIGLGILILIISKML